MNLMLKNCLKNSFIKFKLSKNDQLGWLGKFVQKGPILGALLIFKLFFLIHHGYIWIIIFLTRKVQNWSKLKNFVFNVLITHFYIGFHILIF